MQAGLHYGKSYNSDYILYRTHYHLTFWPMSFLRNNVYVLVDALNATCPFSFGHLDYLYHLLLALLMTRSPYVH